MIDRAEEAFPKTLRPKQLRGLALARSGETKKAQRVLGKLYAAGQMGPETLGIYARTWMDRYTDDGQSHLPAEVTRPVLARRSTAFPTDYYTGINAAAKSLLAGEPETAPSWRDVS